MKAQEAYTVFSMVCFSLGSAMFFYFFLGWSVVEEGYGAFGFLAPYAMFFFFFAVVLQWVVLRWFPPLGDLKGRA